MEIFFVGLRIGHLYRKNCSISDQDIQAVGRVYLYKYPSSQPVKVFEGKENFEQFGYDLDLSVQLKNKRSVISISSYTKGILY